MIWKNRLRAMKAGKKVYKVTSLNRIVFAKSLEQCKIKFRKHESCVMEVGFLMGLIYILFNRVGGK